MLSTRERIIRVGAQILVLEGSKMFTARRIGERLGISDAAVFKHFPSMESIAEEIVERYAKECLRRTERALEREGSAIERLSSVLNVQMEFLEETKGAVPVLCLELSRSGSRRLKRKVQEFFHSFSGRLSALLREGIREGSVRKDIDPEEMSFLLIGILHAKVFQWILRGKKGRIVEDRERFRRMLLEYLEPNRLP